MSPRGQAFLERLRTTVLIGDGALGTMLNERGIGRNTNYERLNLSHPDLIRDLHRAYFDAGARVIETNTFGANRTKLLNPAPEGEVRELNATGVRLAKEITGDDGFVAGAVGPLHTPYGPFGAQILNDDGIRDVFKEQIVALADAGADLLMLESFTDLRQLLLALEVAKSATDLPVICQMAFHEKGHTQHGTHITTALEALIAGKADVIGANCGRGVRCVHHAVEKIIQTSDVLVSAFPNAGLPEYVDGRYLFGAPLPYLTESAVKMADLGVNLIGGCCGTSPEYIRQISQLLQHRSPSVRIHISTTIIETKVEPVSTEPAKPSPPPPGSLLYKIEYDNPKRRPLVVVELDPPRGLNYQTILKRAQQLRDMGVDAITIADNPVATLHMGNLAFAEIVQREADIPVILHLACRDSNLLGLQSRLLEAHVRGLHHILALTGDPAKVGDTPGATSVYDLNSMGLIELIAKFNNGVTNAGMSIGGRTRFTIGGAFDPNKRNLASVVDRLRRKMQNGLHFAMTQPIYDFQRFEHSVALTRDLKVPIFYGLMPLLSERNAEFLHNEVPGIVLSDEVRARMKGYSNKEGRRMGLRITHEMIDMMLPNTDAFYLIPPQKFTEMAVEMVAHIREAVAMRVAASA